MSESARRLHRHLNTLRAQRDALQAELAEHEVPVDIPHYDDAKAMKCVAAAKARDVAENTNTAMQVIETAKAEKAAHHAALAERSRRAREAEKVKADLDALIPQVDEVEKLLAAEIQEECRKLKDGLVGRYQDAVNTVADVCIEVAALAHASGDYGNLRRMNSGLTMPDIGIQVPEGLRVHLGQLHGDLKGQPIIGQRAQKILHGIVGGDEQ